MPRSWTCHWQNKYWRDDVNRESLPVRASGSERLLARGVRPGDTIYVVSILEGFLLLGARLHVEHVTSRDEAVRITGDASLFSSIDGWAVGSGTPMHLHRRLGPDVAHRLRFIAPRNKLRPLAFIEETDTVDPQATRGVHELWPRSARLLDEAISVAAPIDTSTGWLTVTDAMLPASVPAQAQRG